MKILSIETSCDETAVSIIEVSGTIPDVKFKVLSNVLLSQASIHAKYGGVFPNLAKREHSKNLVPILEKALEKAGLLALNSNSYANFDYSEIEKILEREGRLLTQFIKLTSAIDKPDIDAIAVTNGPGLTPALWIGVNFAKALSSIWNIQIIPVNHMEGHILSALISKQTNALQVIQKLLLKKKEVSHFTISKFELPAISLLISGGHTEIVLLSKNSKNNSAQKSNFWNYKIVGQTRDDAVGEAFDKVARMLELSYPGGPEISKLAQIAEKTKEYISIDLFNLPRPMINTNDFDFSFSGLKTAVLYTIKRIPKLTDEIKAKIALEFEKSATEVLVKKTIGSAEKYEAKTIIIGGGVSANKRIRESFEYITNKKKIRLFLPDKELSTDNALMIAIAGYFNLNTKSISNTTNIQADGNLSF